MTQKEKHTEPSSLRAGLVRRFVLESSYTSANHRHSYSLSTSYTQGTIDKQIVLRVITSFGSRLPTGGPDTATAASRATPSETALAPAQLTRPIATAVSLLHSATHALRLQASATAIAS